MCAIKRGSAVSIYEALVQTIENILYEKLAAFIVFTFG